MMDPFYAFLIFIVLLAMEMIATRSWVAAYYRFGIPVFTARRAINVNALPGATPMAAPLALDKTLQARFKDRPGYPALRFKLFANSGEDRTLIAFHEALFEPRSGPRYFPVMHALAHVDWERREVRLTGWLNWNVLFLLFYMVVNTIADRGFLFVAMLVTFLFVLSYLAQAGVNRAVTEEIVRVG
jgi:hypothetical protein